MLSRERTPCRPLSVFCPELGRLDRLAMSEACMDAILALRDRRCESPLSMPRSLPSSSRSESLLELEMAKSPVAEVAPFPPSRYEPEAGRCDPDFRCAPDDERERFPPVPSASSALS